MDFARLFLLLLLCSVAISGAETAAPATDQFPFTDRALWEAGVAGALTYLPDYPAAAQNHMKWIAAPYVVYRGRIMRADREGARASFFRTRSLAAELSVAASFASRSKDNEARAGMPDLDY